MASMRPRLGGPGEHGHRPDDRDVPFCSFNAGTAGGPGGTWRPAPLPRRPARGLQWGHGGAAVETPNSLRGTRRQGMASMRPRLGGRGELVVVEDALLANEVASMRPRLGGRGE